MLDGRRTRESKARDLEAPSPVVAALQPKGAKGMDANTPFDFTPADQLTRHGIYHLGDIQIRLGQDG